MRKLWMPLILLAAVVLSACGGSSGAAPTEVVPTQTATSAPTAVVATTAPAGTPLPTQPVAAMGQPMTNCTVESTLPTPSPAEAARFPAVTEKDWILGNPDAKITLLEYSDFM